MKTHCTLSSEPLPISLNRDFKFPDDGWVQLARSGEVIAPLEGLQKPVQVVQVLDEQAFDAVIASFRAAAAAPNFPGVLIDFEHFSADPDKESRAAGWIEDMKKQDGGLWGKPRLSNSGRAAIEGGDYRLISPVFAFEPRTYKAGEKVRPIAMPSAGLTNDPRIKGMKPISNRDGTPAGASSENQNNAPMKSLLKLLGLAEDASEESAVAAVQALIDKASKVEAANRERDTLLALQVEADLDKHNVKGEARNKWKPALIANRAQTLELLSSLGTDGSGYAVTHNREKAKAPAAKDGDAEVSIDAKRSAAVNEYRTRNRGCSFQAAWDAVRAEKPELFADPVAAE